MKIGIFGGTFNPPHKAHLVVAKKSIHQLKLSRIYFVPNNISPHKRNEKQVSGFHRFKMLKLLIGKYNKMMISKYEISRKEISYTFDTIKYFKNKYKKSELYLIIGSDNLKNINSWKNIDYILKNTILVIAPRIQNVKFKVGTILDMDPIYLSSTIIREKIISHKNCKKYISNEIYNYQKKNNLYL